MNSAFIFPPVTPRPVRSVLGEIPYTSLGITDAHNHVWIDPIPGADGAAPVLNQYDAIRTELRLYRSGGGASILDFQPGGCGRDGRRLVQLSKDSGVQIIACTGFHRQKYYTPGHWLFSASSQAVTEYFSDELSQSLEETRGQVETVRAGFIKVALEANWKSTPLAALEASAEAARASGALVAVHTEKGTLAEKAVIFYQQRGLAPQQLVLCHVDKRPDLSLHAELARYGVLVEYDTFYRPKYEPETRLWPLIEGMVKLGLSHRVALATDMAEARMYASIGGGPGLASLPVEIKRRLHKMGIPEHAVQQMLGGNIARRLAGLD